MSKKDQELLLIDLSARLPYNTIMNGKLPNNVGRDNIDFVIEPALLAAAIACGCKPYLRPMSSMTEEEREYYDGIRRYLVRDDWEVVDWLNANHFDYRGLIPMGLALEVREGMYNIKTTCDNCKDKNYCSQSEYVKTNCCKLKSV